MRYPVAPAVLLTVALVAGAPAIQAGQGRFATEVLLKTPEVTLLSAREGQWCDHEEFASVLAIWNVDESHPIRDDASYRQFFTATLLPAIEARCQPPLSDVAVSNYVAGAVLPATGNENADTVRYPELAGSSLNHVHAARKGTSPWTFEMFYWGADPGVDWGDPGLASIAAMRRLLAGGAAERAASQRRTQDYKIQISAALGRPVYNPPALPAETGGAPEPDAPEPVNCDQKSAVRSASSYPSAREICHAFVAQVAQGASKVGASEDLYRALTGRKGTAPFTLRVVEFELARCERIEGGAAYRCDYDSRIVAGGGESGLAALLKPFLQHAYRSRSIFENQGGTWRQRPPAPTPYSQLPCCWQGDIRVVGLFEDCRESC